MNYHTQKFLEIMREAQPASGYRPQTEAEWLRRQLTMIAASYHMYRAIGVPKAEAKRVARLIHGGLAGRRLLEMSISEPENLEVAQ